MHEFVTAKLFILHRALSHCKHVIFYLVLWAMSPTELWHHSVYSISSHMSETVQDLFSNLIYTC